MKKKIKSETAYGVWNPETGIHRCFYWRRSDVKRFFPMTKTEKIIKVKIQVIK